MSHPMRKYLRWIVNALLVAAVIVIIAALMDTSPR